MPKVLNDKIIINDVLRVINETNDISFKNYKIHGKYPESTIISHFKNWTCLLKNLNIKPINDRNISKKEIILDIKDVFKKTNNTTQLNYIKYGQYSKAPIKRLFGSWNNLLSELGIELNINNNYSKEEILNQYKSLCDKKNKILTAIDFRKYSIYSQSIIDKVFGSFTNLKKELNLSIDSRFITDKEILDDLKNLYKQYGFISLSLITQCSIVSAPTVINRFGSIYKACELSDIQYTVENNNSMFCKFILSICKEVLGEDYKLEYTFDWLINLDTSKHLFIDIYYPKLNLAIEVDGEQHYKYVPKFHTSLEDFHYAQYRDMIKEKLLNEHNIHLIRIKEKTKLEEIKNILSFYSNG